MKVLLLKDVYKLGEAGDVKKVANGYARNYLLPRGLAVAATQGALLQSERLRAAATTQREQENREKSGLAEQLEGLRLTFAVRASDQGRLYGSVTHQMIADAVSEASDEKIDRRSVLSSPIRELGRFQVPIRLTADLIPNVEVIVHREGEEEALEVEASVEETSGAAEEEAAAAEAEVEAEVVTETESEPAPEEEVEVAEE